MNMFLLRSAFSTVKHDSPVLINGPHTKEKSLIKYVRKLYIQLKTQFSSKNSYEFPSVCGKCVRVVSNFFLKQRVETFLGIANQPSNGNILHWILFIRCICHHNLGNNKKKCRLGLGWAWVWAGWMPKIQHCGNLRKKMDYGRSRKN